MTERTKYYCVMDDCKTRAYYNYSNREYPEYCEDDKKEDMADFRYGICRYINDNNIQCNIRATYGKIGTKNASYCYSCYNKLDDEIKKTIENVVSKKCIKCNKKIPTFNKPGETQATHCGDCKEDGMIDIKSKKCIKCNKKQPNFNKPGETVVTHCGDCKEDGMIDIKHPKCIKCEKKIPTFNKPGETVATHCGDCKEVGMINIISKRCIKCEKKIPTFNKPGETQATHCGDCKEIGMVDIKNPKCIKCKNKIPNFNKPEETLATHCGYCKEVGMINIKSKKCIKCNKKIPTFNKPGETVATHCGDCKEVGMVDIKSKKCIKCEKKQPVFNKPDETVATHCGDCKEVGMIDIKSKKCIKCNKKRPNFNKQDETLATHCGDCKEVDMVNINSKKCISSMCDILANSKYKGYCFRCFIHTFPDGKNSRNYKTKERSVVEFINKTFTETFKDYKIINDKVISGGCSKRRPDILIDVITHCIIIEIDEDAHINYSCENKRMMEISQDLGHPNIVFIRFNPDAYTNNEGKKVKSCWKVNKSGICLIDSKSKWKERLDNLKNLIEYWLNNIPEKHITIEKLYYSINTDE